MEYEGGCSGLEHVAWFVALPSDSIGSLQERKPKYTLHHLVRERPLRVLLCSLKANRAWPWSVATETMHLLC